MYALRSLNVSFLFLFAGKIQDILEAFEAVDKNGYGTISNDQLEDALIELGLFKKVSFLSLRLIATANERFAADRGRGWILCLVVMVVLTGGK